MVRSDDDGPGSRRVRCLLTWVLPALVVVGWIAIGGFAGPYAGKLADVQSNNDASFLPSNAESVQVSRLTAKFHGGRVNPAVVVYVRRSGITAADRAAATADATALGRNHALARSPVGPLASKDGKALEVIAPLRADLGQQLSDVVAHIRKQVQAGRPPGLQAQVTGPAGLAADLVGAFGGIDGILLVVAIAVVLAILVAVYRSPILPVVVLISAVFALAAASGVVYLLANHDVLTLNGQSQGILFILVVGAATDYALLLTARFREELREHRSRRSAMKAALRRAAGPIAAAADTVIAGLLCLLASNLNSTSSLGPVAAIGIVAALVSALTFLPAALLLLGRAAFWPRPPRYGSAHPERSGLWGHISTFVAGRARPVWVGVAIPLLVLAGFASVFKASGTAQTALFLNKVPSVTGQRMLTEHFPAGRSSPVIVVGPEHATKTMLTTAGRISGIVAVAPVTQAQSGRRSNQAPKVRDGLVEVDATLRAPPGSEAAKPVVRKLRTAEHRAVPQAKVGGFTALQLDTASTAEADRTLIIPVILAVIFVLLMLLLRAVLLPLLLVASVVLNFAATLGVSALVFNHVLDFPGADPSVPLYAFVFLVALGIDYNIFLLTRVREEAVRHGTRPGVVRGLVATGGVITSAGVVLAATFSALSVVPILFLAQIAFLVAFGVLLDTIVVRSLLVPALTHDLGRRAWWPNRLAGDTDRRPVELNSSAPTS
jgi:RND superfamily putative drug exporter